MGVRVVIECDNCVERFFLPFAPVVGQAELDAFGWKMEGGRILCDVCSDPESWRNRPPVVDDVDVDDLPLGKVVYLLREERFHLG